MTPDVPLLAAALAIVAVVGIVSAVRRYRRRDAEITRDLRNKR